MVYEFKIGDRIISTFYENKGLKGIIIDNGKGGNHNCFLIRWNDGKNYGSNNVFRPDLLILSNPITLKEFINS